MTFDNWKCTNPADEFLGPEPDADDELMDHIHMLHERAFQELRTRDGLADACRHASMGQAAAHQGALSMAAFCISAAVGDMGHAEAELERACNYFQTTHVATVMALKAMRTKSQGDLQ